MSSRSSRLATNGSTGSSNKSFRGRTISSRADADGHPVRGLGPRRKLRYPTSNAIPKLKPYHPPPIFLAPAKLAARRLFASSPFFSLFPSPTFTFFPSCFGGGGEPKLLRGTGLSRLFYLNCTRECTCYCHSWFGLVLLYIPKWFSAHSPRGNWNFYYFGNGQRWLEGTAYKEVGHIFLVILLWSHGVADKTTPFNQAILDELVDPGKILRVGSAWGGMFSLTDSAIFVIEVAITILPRNHTADSFYVGWILRCCCIKSVSHLVVMSEALSTSTTRGWGGEAILLPIDKSTSFYPET